jgi:DNA-binding transcriptional regulator YiaG
VKASEKPLALLVEWDQNKAQTLIDISDFLKTFKIYAPLRKSSALFNQVQVGDLGTDVVWSDEIDMSAETLWRLAQEQSGLTLTADAFKKWRSKQGYTLDETAEALGISRRMVAYYEEGKRPIPRVVALATLAFDNHGNPVFRHTG